MSLITTAAGCSADAYEEEEASSSEKVLGNNPRTAYQFFVQQGLSNIQSAAIVGNLMQESTRSVNPASVQPRVARKPRQREPASPADAVAASRNGAPEAAGTPMRMRTFVGSRRRAVA